MDFFAIFRQLSKTSNYFRVEILCFVNKRFNFDLLHVRILSGVYRSEV